MKIKIGNFNFINKKGNKFSLLDYNISSDLFNYFYLDGKEDTLYVNSDYYFELSSEVKYNNISELDFEKQLLEKYKVVDYSKEITNQVNSFIQEKAKEIFKSQNYSRYNLYNNISLDDILNTKENSKFFLDYRYETSVDFDNNKITKNDISFNLYLGKIENLEEMYKEGKLEKQIKASLINLELENNIAPKFVTELIKINEFLKDKQSANILFKDYSKFKIDPHIYSFLDIRENNIALRLGYDEEKLFLKANPYKDIKGLKLEDLQGLSYGKQVLEINPENLKDLEKQIVLSVEDKLAFKIDRLKKELREDFVDYGVRLCHENYKAYSNFPVTPKLCLSELVKIDIKNERVDTTRKEEYPSWYSKELEVLLNKDELIESLVVAEDIETLERISNRLGDEELKDIVKEIKEQESYEEYDEEEW